MAQDPFAGLGDHEPRWYGGKVIFRARLVIPKDEKWNGSTSRYRIILEQPEIGPSYDYARRFGSGRFLRIKVPQCGDHLVNYFSRPFVLLGRVFRSLFYKEKTVFMVETNEQIVDGNIISPPWRSNDRGPWPFLEFVRWANPPHVERNQKQVRRLRRSRSFLNGLCLFSPFRSPFFFCRPWLNGCRGFNWDSRIPFPEFVCSSQTS